MLHTWPDKCRRTLTTGRTSRHAAASGVAGSVPPHHWIGTPGRRVRATLSASALAITVVASGDAVAGCPDKARDLRETFGRAQELLEQRLRGGAGKGLVCDAIARLAGQRRLISYLEANQIVCVIDVAEIEDAQAELKETLQYPTSLAKGRSWNDPR